MDGPAPIALFGRLHSAPRFVLDGQLERRLRRAAGSRALVNEPAWPRSVLRVLSWGEAGGVVSPAT